MASIKQSMSRPISADVKGVKAVVNEASDGIQAVPTELVIKAADDSTFTQISDATPMPVKVIGGATGGSVTVAAPLPTGTNKIGVVDAQLTGSVPSLKRLSSFTKISGDGIVKDLNVSSNTIVVPFSRDAILSATGPSSNYGITAIINTSAGAGNIRRGLLSADFSGINPSAISSAKIKLFDTNVATPASRTENGTFDLYALKASNGDWIEGTKNGAAATTGEPTWNNKAYSTVAWTGGVGLGNPGDGYDASPIATLPSTVGYSGYVEGVLDLTAFKNYLSVNSGFLLKVTDETKNTTGTQFASREGSANQKPYFEIVTSIVGQAAYISFEASAVGAKLLDGTDPAGAGISIPSSGLVVPATTNVPYKIYVPTGVDVVWQVLGYA